VPTHVAQREDRAGLARGDWTLIARIIHEEFAGEDHAVVEYEPSRRRLPNNAEQRDDAPGRREARDRRARRRARGAGGAISGLHGDDCARDTRARSGERARTLSAAAVAFVIRTSTAAPSPAQRGAWAARWHRRTRYRLVVMRLPDVRRRGRDHRRRPERWGCRRR
jgi:hypothetical protein